ncbi:U-box domain-containing protein 43-like isoform X1 [Rhodamnia argentea]|uniref:RING-type E3 ubiquitin transferase n=1 Tax=Rhodamnia argentea TaxID=178133 RepID=A0A8B8PRJ4_9MYRT|nr:U-box domain-containing protein 43-like isoform X1 [Rhodamnia argentea]
MTLSAAAAVESVRRSLARLSSSDHNHQFENSKRFCAFVPRLQLLIDQLLLPSPSPENLPASVQTSLRGIAVDLESAAETVLAYVSKSKVFVLINCKSLLASIQQRTAAIGGWLALLESAIHENPDLKKKIADLSRDMKQAEFIVTEDEERVHLSLQKEGEGRRASKAVQSAIVMELARALGMEAHKYTELSAQVKLLKNDLVRSNSITERRILISLEKILTNWSMEPNIQTGGMDLDFEEGAQISPFKNFLCPLTKEVMKDPVVLESSQTYEREAIKYWFERCIDDARDVTCPVTGQVLKSLELKPNIGLAGAIEEWVNRNIEIQVKSAVQCLSEEPLKLDEVERVLDSIYRIAEDYPSSRYRVRNAGLVLIIIKLLRNSSKSIGTHLRSKTLLALLGMAKDEESKKIMLEEGMTRLAIHSLTGSSEKEREHAIKLLREFSNDEAYCKKIALEKGALVLLTSLAGNLEHPTLSNLAVEVLARIETIEENIQYLAAAGRFEPLLSRLCEGSDEVRITMATMLGSMTMTSNSKLLVARQSAKILVPMLAKEEGKAPSLRALHNLSSVDDNASILVNSSMLPSLIYILFEDQDASLELKELAASTMANVVSNPGHWELACTDKKGHLLQSKPIITKLLGLLSSASSKCQASALRILYGMSLSPQASESVASYIMDGQGLEKIILFLDHAEDEQRLHACKLTRLLSERFHQDLASRLRSSDKIPLLKEKILDRKTIESERSDTACILANLPLAEEDVTTLLGASFLRWSVDTIKNHQQKSKGRTFKSQPSMVEGLLGLLLQFTRSTDPEILSVIRELSLMSVFCEQLNFPSKPRMKQLAALGLKNLSETGRVVAAGHLEPPPPQRLCSSLVFMCGCVPPEPSRCPIHNSLCEEHAHLCLLQCNCIKPLVDLLDDEDTDVQVAAVEALSTLILESSRSLKCAVEEFERQDAVDALINLFSEVRAGELQERTAWMIERIIRVESQSSRHSLNQNLVRALIEALRHGNANTKRHAQDALTNLKQISGVSGSSSSQIQLRR